jgi:hypothetical protein
LNDDLQHVFCDAGHFRNLIHLYAVKKTFEKVVLMTINVNREDKNDPDLWRNVMMEKTFISIFRKILAVKITVIIIFPGLLFSTQAFSNTDALRFSLTGNSQQSENVINIRLIGANDY